MSSTGKKRISQAAQPGLLSPQSVSTWLEFLKRNGALTDGVKSILLDDCSLRLHGLPVGEVQLKPPQFVLFVDTREKGDSCSVAIIKPSSMCEIMLELNVWTVACELPIGDYIFAEYDADAAAAYAAERAENGGESDSDDDDDADDECMSPTLASSSSNHKKHVRDSATARSKGVKRAKQNVVRKIPPYYAIRCVVERKAMPDLILSTRGGHRHDQRHDMMLHNSPNNVWLVTGRLDETSEAGRVLFSGVRDHEVFSLDGLDKHCKTAFLHLDSDAEVPMVLRNGMRRTAESLLAQRAARPDNAGAVYSYVHGLKKTNATPTQRYANAVALLIENLGVNRAAALQKIFPSIADLFKACTDAVAVPSNRNALVVRIAALDVAPVGVKTTASKKMGEKRAQKIVDGLLANYKPPVVAPARPTLSVAKSTRYVLEDDEDGDGADSDYDDDD